MLHALPMSRTATPFSLFWLMSPLLVIASLLPCPALAAAPVLDPPNVVAAYTEGGPPVALQPGLTITDADSGTLLGATVAISDFRAGDVLAVGSPGSFTAGYDAGTGELTLSGAGAVADLQAALRTVTYASGSDDPSFGGTDATRAIAFVVEDDTGDSGSATAQVLISSVNDAPQLSTSGGSTSFVAGDNVTSTPVAVDGGLVVTDPDDATLVSGTVSIGGGFRAGQDVLHFTNDGATMGNIAASYNAVTGVLTLTSAGGTATLAQWQAALRTVAYTDTSITPDTATRTVIFGVDDGTDASTPATRTVTVTAVDQTPIVTTTGGITNYLGGAAAVTIDDSVTVSDLDNTTLSAGTVSIGAGFASGDVLAFSNVSSVLFGNIAGSYNAATGVLTLTSAGATATSGQWSNALSAVTFSSTSTHYGNRTIAFAVNDGVKTSPAATATVALLGPPAVTAVGSTAADGGYKVADTINLTVTFDMAVVVDTTGGSPALRMETGSVDRDAVYVFGSGSATLTFAYTVQAGDSSADLDYTSTAALALGGAAIRSGAGVDAALDLPLPGGAGSIAGAHAITVDGIAPVVASVAIPANGTYLTGQNLDFTVDYSEAVTVDTSGGTPRIAITLDTGGTVHADYVAGSGTTALLFRHTVVAGEADPDGIALATLVDANGGSLRDAVGNDAAATLNGVPATTGVLVGKAGQTITFGAQAAQTFVPGGTFVLDPLATASSGLPVSYRSQTTGVCTISGSTVTMVAAGTCTIAADQAGDASYEAAPTVTQSIAIGAGSQTIAFGAQAAQTFVPGGTFVLDPLATASSGLPVSYSSQTTGVCTISGSTVTMVAAGTCTIAADQAGDANYEAAATVARSIAIGKAAQAITGFATNPEAPTFAPNGTFTVSASGGGSDNPVVFASTTGAVCRVGGDVVTMLAAGTCTLTADQAGDVNYTAAPRQVLDVAIAKATPTLAWIDALQKVVGEPAFDLPDPDSDSTGAFTFTSSDPGVATVDGHRVTLVGPGTTTLVATQAGTRDYTEATISTTLTVTARPDPTRDPEVIGTIQGQVDASLRFAAAQQRNIADRLRQLRAGGGNPSGNTLAVRYAGAGGGLALPLGSESGTRRLFPAGMWAAGTISIGRRDPVDDSGRLGFRSDGVTVGIDRAFGEHLALGVAGGYGWSDTDTGEASTLDGRQRSLAGYGLWHGRRNLFVDGMVGFGELDFDIARRSEVAAATAHARRGGDQLFGALTFGYEHAGEHLTLTSYGRYEASRTTLDAYAESGLGLYDLRYGRQTVDDSGLALGIEGRHQFATPSATWRPYWLLEYRSALHSRSDVGINYVVQPVASDYVLGLRSSFDDALSIGAGLDVDLSRNWRLALQFRHEQAGSNRADSYGLQLSWGNAGPILTRTVVEAQLQDPRETANRAPWPRQP